MNTDELTTTGLYLVHVQERGGGFNQIIVQGYSMDTAWDAARDYYCHGLGLPDVWERASITVNAAAQQLTDTAWILTGSS